MLYETDFLTVVFCISLLALLVLKAKASKLEQNYVKLKCSGNNKYLVVSDSGYSGFLANQVKKEKQDRANVEWPSRS